MCKLHFITWFMLHQYPIWFVSPIDSTESLHSQVYISGSLVLSVRMVLYQSMSLPSFRQHLRYDAWIPRVQSPNIWSVAKGRSPALPWLD